MASYVSWLCKYWLGTRPYGRGDCSKASQKHAPMHGSHSRGYQESSDHPLMQDMLLLLHICENSDSSSTRLFSYYLGRLQHCTTQTKSWNWPDCPCTTKYWHPQNIQTQGCLCWLGETILPSASWTITTLTSSKLSMMASSGQTGCSESQRSLWKGTTNALHLLLLIHTLIIPSPHTFTTNIGYANSSPTSKITIILPTQTASNDSLGTAMSHWHMSPLSTIRLTLSLKLQQRAYVACIIKCMRT